MPEFPVKTATKAAPDLHLLALDERQTVRFFWPSFFDLQGVNSLLSKEATSCY